MAEVVLRLDHDGVAAGCEARERHVAVHCRGRRVAAERQRSARAGRRGARRVDEVLGGRDGTAGVRRGVRRGGQVRRRRVVVGRVRVEDEGADGRADA